MAARRYLLVCAVLALAFGSGPSAGRAQTIPAFSGADGAARNVSGGRGGIVYHVTKLNSAIDDPQRDSFGTIRYGLNSANFPAGVPRTIVFDAGGVFHLGRLTQAGWDPNGNGWDAQSRLTIGGTNVTLAGQTAPGTGVIFMGGGLKPQGNNNIVRNITVAAGYGLTGWWKPGDPFRAVPGTPEAGTDASQWFPDNTVFDGMDISGTNLMIDHVSTLYATDESISMNEVASNITVQYSNISQGQNYPQWDAENPTLTGHALGSLLEAGNSTAQAAISFHHNLYAHQKARVPQMQSQSGSLGAYYDFRNNVFYNWFGTAGSKSGATFLNLVNNFYLAGDGGDQPIGGSNPGVTTQGGGTSVISTSSNVHRTGNLIDSNKDADPFDTSSLPVSGSPLWKGGVVTYAGVTDPAAQAFNNVLNFAGANWWTRDGVIDTPDERIINEARTGTGKIIAWADDPWNNDPNEGVEWRALKNTPQTNRAAEWDAEANDGYGVGDGMPTAWELAHGLDPNARDNNGDFDNDGYTNLEEYLNEVAAWPAFAPIVFTGATNNRYAQITNWDVNSDAALTHNWQPSRYDTVDIHAGVAVVDAVGQHAGTLNVGPAVGDAATLNVVAGWIETGIFEAGMAGAGTVNQSGGIVTANHLQIGRVLSGNGVYNLSGGVLHVTSLYQAPTTGFLNFTGGTLIAESVAFNLVNGGGMFVPGGESREATIRGNLTMDGGSIFIELGGVDPADFGNVLIEGALAAGGSLTVAPTNGFAPVVGNTFDIFDFESAAGMFNLELPQLGAGLAWDVSDLLTTGELSVVNATTDFDGDGDIDGTDFLTWQSGFGLTGPDHEAEGDANGDDVVDGLDLASWQAQHLASSAVGAGQGVPEPQAALLALVLAGQAIIAHRKSRRAPT